MGLATAISTTRLVRSVDIISGLGRDICVHSIIREAAKQNGRKWNTRSGPERSPTTRPMRSMVLGIMKSTLARDSITPLGSPLVPEV